MLFALGLGDQVVAVTHECDWPPEAASLPHLTRTVVPAGLSAAEIDRAVRETVGAGRPLYELDAERLAQLDPELIVTQAICDVCAVSYDDVVAVAATLPSKPRVISLDPMTLDEVLDDVRRLGDAAEATAESRLLREQARRRIDAVEPRGRGRTAPACRRDRVARPGLHRRPLGAGDDPAGRRRGRAGQVRRALAHGRVGGDRRGRARRRPRDALRLRRRALGRGGGAVRRAARARSGRSAPWPSTPPPTSRGPVPAWSRASSCSGTSCTPTACRHRPEPSTSSSR